MQTPRVITISGTRHQDGWEYTVAHGQQTFTGKAEDELQAVEALARIMYQLPVIPVRLEGDVPGFKGHGDELYHPHTVREAFCRVIGNATLEITGGAS